MMKRVVILLFVCAMVACTRSSNDYVDGVILFDHSIDYPEIDLKLSDVADITYIPLKGVDEGFSLGYFFPINNEIYINGDEIYIRQERGGIHVFDMAGNPVRRLDRTGRGPEEYGTYASDFWVEPERNSIYVAGSLGSGGIYEYDATSLNFKDKGHPEFNFLARTVPLNRDYVIVYNRPRPSNPGNLATFYLLAKSDWELKPLAITPVRPGIPDVDAQMTHSSIIQGRGGVFLCDTHCDTIWWIDRSTLEVTPRMVDKTDYPRQDPPKYGSNIMALPSFETDRYLFFSPVYWPLHYPNLKRRAYVFDKKREKIFRLPQTSEWRYSLAEDPRLYEIGWDEYWLSARNTTLNEEYGAVIFQAMHLIDNMDKLSPELKKIAATLQEDDNPVLALIKLK